MRHKSLLRTLLFATIVIVLWATEISATQAQQGTPALVTTPLDSNVRVALHGNVHPSARAGFDQGEAPPDLEMKRMILVLRRSPEQETALLHLLENQQNRNSPQYHKWLTPADVGNYFGPADLDIAAVTNWLNDNGFQISKVSNGRTFIEFSGTAAQVKKAFGTGVHDFLINGEHHWANISDPTIPAALAPVIAGIDSLHNFPRKARNRFLGSYSQNERRLISPAPSFTFVLGQYIQYAVSPFDFAAIYDLLPLWQATPTQITGAGQTIAIVGRTDINPTDAPTFWNLFGLDGVHAPQPQLVITYNGPNPGINADEGEADIDTQWSGAVAPGATINFVTSESTETTDGVDLSALYIVDNNLGSVISESYGECEANLGAGGVSFYGSLWEQAAAQGISVFVSTGDNGSAGCDDPASPAQNGLNVNGIASTPFNAAIGGTDFNQYNKWSTYWNSSNTAITQQSAKGYIPETTWNDSCSNGLLQFLSGGSTNLETNCNSSNFSAFLNSIGGSGGQSQAWLKPTWQTGTLNDNARDLPDVSLFASNGFLGSFYVVCQSDATSGCSLYSLAGYGGTSVASPAFAGIMALVNQKTGSAQGIPGLILYRLAAQQAGSFHDVPQGTTIAVPCFSGTTNCITQTAGHSYGLLSGFATGTSYDLATGLGSVDAANLVNNWNTVTFTPSATSLALNSGNPVNVKHGFPVAVSITVNPATATGTVGLLVSPGTPGKAGVESFALSAGSFNGSTSLLPGGNYSLIAHYAGDTTYGGSYSNSVPVNVSAETSRTLPNLVTLDINRRPLSFTASSATYGNGYSVLRVDVGDSNASVSSSSGISSACSNGLSSCPTGSVTLAASGSPLNGINLLLNGEGYSEDQSVPPGTYTVSATYAGDASYSSSTGTTSFAIAKAPTTAAAGVSGLPVQYGDFEQIDADIATTSDGIAPTGTFQFMVDGSPIGNPVPVYESGAYNPNTNPPYAWADAISSTEFLSVGNHTLSVQYSGDGNYAPSISPPATVTVSQALPSVNNYGWLTYNQPVVVGQTISTTAQLYGSQAGVAPTGTITFFDNNSLIPGIVTYSSQGGNLNATIPYTFTSPGNHTLTVKYSGDSNYLPTATTDPFPLNVLGPVSVTPAGNITIATPGQPGSTSLAITPNAGFSGTVSLSCSPDPGAKESSCSFTSGSSSGPNIQIAVSGSGTTVGFNVNTTAPHQRALGALLFSSGPSRLALGAMVVLCLPITIRRRKYCTLLAAITLALSLSACGGGSAGSGGGGNGDPGTSAGTYSFVVVATTGSAPNAISISTPVVVSVK